jgi:hypothetical protein
MATFLLILASFAAIVVLFLFLSWYIRFQASILLKENELDYRIAVALGGRNMGIGFARIESMSYLFLGSPGRERFKWRLGGKKPEEKKVTAEAKEKQPISKRWPKITAIPYGKLLAAVKRSIKWRDFGVRGVFGWQNPAVTGQFFGALSILNAFIGSHRFNVNMTPDFDRQIVDLDCRSAVSFRPAVLAWRLGSTYLFHKR